MKAGISGAAVTLAGRSDKLARAIFAAPFFISRMNFIPSFEL
jgi:hypothetical protein